MHLIYMELKQEHDLTYTWNAINMQLQNIIDTKHSLLLFTDGQIMRLKFTKKLLYNNSNSVHFVKPAIHSDKQIMIRR